MDRFLIPDERGHKELCTRIISALTNEALLICCEQTYLWSCKTKGDYQMGIRTTLKKWAAYQQTVRELAALDNRQLNDLGISRTDISRIARDHARTI
jgi:uncharacterized protein YjiS (DUF1127 family)